MKWFRHLSNASDDEFMVRLEESLGLDGVARWWKTLEAIASQMDETSRCGAAYPARKWCEILRGKRKKVAQFLAFCAAHEKLQIAPESGGFSVGSENVSGTFREQTENQLKTFLKDSQNVLKIECPKLLKLRDNYSRNLQAAESKQPTTKEVDVEGEVEDISNPDGLDGEHASGASTDQTREQKKKTNHPPPCPANEIIELYHEILPMCPRIAEPDSGQLKNDLRARWRSSPKRQSLAWWGRFFIYIDQYCPFLKGEAYDPKKGPFIKGLRWMVKSGNFACILEGQYDRRNKESRGGAAA